MKFGLIGEKTDFSYSPFIHGNFNYEYFLYDVKKSELSEFVKNCNLDGYNVTAPYKKRITEYLDRLSPLSQRIGAVNTVVKKDGKLFGYNTDYYGLKFALSKAGIKIAKKKVMILGSGGTAQTAKVLVEDLGGTPILVSRTGEINYKNYLKHKDANVVINATPVGNVNNESLEPLVHLKKFKNLEGVFDATYNPNLTKLMLIAKELKVKCALGLDMLIYQAIESAKIFTGETPSVSYEDIKKKIIKRYFNFYLVGMGGAGKSVIGKELAKRLNKDFYDTDKIIEQEEKTSVPEIFSKYGEYVFREKEKSAIKRVSKNVGSVISLGGGAVLSSENYYFVKRNGFVIFIERKLKKLDIKQRPAYKNKRLKNVYKYRYPYYKKFADLTVKNKKSVTDTVEKILELL